MLPIIIHYSFTLYSLMIVINLVGSWFPQMYQYQAMRFVVHYTNPYLNIFRKIIPPLGGVLDLSPILAFLLLRFCEKILLLIIL